MTFLYTFGLIFVKTCRKGGYKMGYVFKIWIKSGQLIATHSITNSKFI